MPYLLSLLDKSPIEEGGAAVDALRTTVRLAQKAEELGYHRFWVAEHHSMANLASSAPETLIAYLLAKTARIRVGSGGVMLQHYSAYKVAETFNLLASLAPGRVDLGVGKAPGGFPLSTRALQVGGGEPAGKPDFAEQLAGINTYLAADPASEGPHATPFPPAPPERFLLGASVDSAELAAAKGWRLVFAGQLNGDPENLRKTFDAYTHASGGKTPILALAAYAAEDADVARKAVSDLRIVKVFLADGRSVNVGTEEQAAEYARQAGVAIDRLESKAPSVLHGTAAEVRAQLDDLHSRYGISEFIIETPALAAGERLASIERLAKERLSLAA